jgi:hypothetical protein
VGLSALTPLPDGAPVTFTVHRHDAPLAEPAPASWRSPSRPSPGPVLGAAKGQVQGGVVTASWAPPSGYDPFDWLSWLGEAEGARLQPPVFVVEAGEEWAFSRPPGPPLERLRLETTGAHRGRALLGDGRLVRFESVDGLMRGRREPVVALQLDDHIVEGRRS